MLTGLEEGQVQLLTREIGDVKVTRNRMPIFGWSADEILMSLLDVREPTDLTTVVDVQRLGELSIKEALTDDEQAELVRLREEVSRRLSYGPTDSQVEFLVKYLGAYLRNAGGRLGVARKNPAQGETKERRGFLKAMHWVDRGPEPNGLAAIRIARTGAWVAHYRNRVGNRPSDSEWRRFYSDLSAPFHGLCAYCEEITRGEVDHFRPVSRFPHRVYQWSNWVFACHYCNWSKSNRWPPDGYVDPCAEYPEERPDHLLHF